MSNTRRISMKKAAVRCSRCHRRCVNDKDWNTMWKQGVLVGFVCPDCQTPEESLEARVNQSVYDYDRMQSDPDGRMRLPLKGAQP